MKIQNLPDLAFNDYKTQKEYEVLQHLIAYLKNTPNLPYSIILVTNRYIDDVDFTNDANSLVKDIKNCNAKLCSLMVLQLNVYPKRYHTRRMSSMGFITIGLPSAFIFWLTIEEIHSVGLGIVFGLIVGHLIGIIRDQRLKQMGKQLDIDIKAY